MPETFVKTGTIVKTILGFAAICSLSACGFNPVYNKNGSGIGPFNVTPIDGRIGYFLKKDLEDFSKLETSNENPRTLKVTIKALYYNTNLRTNAFTARTQIDYNASYSLTGVEGKPPVNGFVKATVGYDSPENKAYSEVALLQDAEERAANEISQKIWQDIIMKTK